VESLRNQMIRSIHSVLNHRYFSVADFPGADSAPPCRYVAQRVVCAPYLVIQ